MLLLNSPYTLILGFIFPQLILLIFNSYGWYLIVGETNEMERSSAIIYFIIEFVLLFINMALFIFLTKYKRLIHWKTSLFLFILHLGALWILVPLKIVPQHIPNWILGSGYFSFGAITLLMPAIALSLYLFSSTPSSLSRKKERFYTLLFIILPPLFWYLINITIQPFYKGDFFGTTFVIFFLAITIIFLSAIFRSFSVVLNRERAENPYRHYIIVFFLALIAPLAGLVLNSGIGFPFDFQNISIYILTIINALLLLPRPNQNFAIPLLFARALAFPFIAYFCLIFLPFLPFSLLAIILVGLGFLMLTPVALCIFQGHILFDDFQNVSLLFSKKLAVFITLLGFMIIPSYFIINTFIERQAIHRTLTLIYSADLNSPAPSDSQINKSIKVLEKLDNRKKQNQLPLIANFYNKIVFGNMTLPDKKIAHLYQLLSNQDINNRKYKNTLFNTNKHYRERRNRTRAPAKKAILKQAQITVKSEGKTTLQLKLYNPDKTTSQVEYNSEITLPEGVFVSGLRLKIDSQWVDGKIFDRKTAEWVYKKITEVRQDPALLIYKTPHKLNLRVFPFPEQGYHRYRDVEIDFIFPKLLKAEITLEDQKINLNPKATDAFIYNSSSALLLSKNNTLPHFKRTPYLHFILDYSTNMGDPYQDYHQKIKLISKQLGISNIRLSVANLAYQPLSEKPFKIDSKIIKNQLNQVNIEQKGGFWASMAIKKVLFQYHQNLNNKTFKTVPIIVLLSLDKLAKTEKETIDFAKLQWLTPDVDTWYLGEVRKLTQYNFEKQSIKTQKPDLAEITILKQNQKIMGIAQHSRLTQYQPNTYYFSPSEDRFIKLAQSSLKPVSKVWEKSAKLWLDWRDSAINPVKMEQNRRQLLNQSRTDSTLIPSGALMVVENSAQWKILAQKEAQSLANKDSFEFSEHPKHTPEPPAWLLILGFLLFSFFYYKLSRSRDVARNV